MKKLDSAASSAAPHSASRLVDAFIIQALGILQNLEIDELGMPPVAFGLHLQARGSVMSFAAACLNVVRAKTRC